MFETSHDMCDTCTYSSVLAERSSEKREVVGSIPTMCTQRRRQMLLNGLYADPSERKAPGP